MKWLGRVLILLICATAIFMVVQRLDEAKPRATLERHPADREPHGSASVGWGGGEAMNRVTAQERRRAHEGYAARDRAARQATQESLNSGLSRQWKSWQVVAVVAIVAALLLAVTGLTPDFSAFKGFMPPLNEARD